MNTKPCTCDWSPVNTTTEDPPHIVWRNLSCPHHGWEAVLCPEDEGQFEAVARRRDAREGFND